MTRKDRYRNMAPRMNRRLPATVVGLAALAWIGGQGLGADADQRFLLRGQKVDATTFSLSELRSSADSELVAAVHGQLLSRCMEQRGFEYPAVSEPEADDFRYAEAMTGDDGTAAKPPQHSVSLASGKVHSVYATWTPDSCIYQADSALFDQPFLREALRQQVLLLRAEADRQLAESDGFKSFQDVVEECAKRPVDAGELLAALEPDLTPSNLRMPARLSDRCMGTHERGTLKSLRSEHDYRVAAADAVNVGAWVDILDAEIAAARTIGQRS